MTNQVQNISPADKNNNEEFSDVQVSPIDHAAALERHALQKQQLAEVILKTYSISIIELHSVSISRLWINTMKL